MHICLYSKYNCESILFEIINELLLIKLITVNKNNFSLQLNFKGRMQKAGLRDSPRY